MAESHVSGPFDGPRVIAPAPVEPVFDHLNDAKEDGR